MANKASASAETEVPHSLHHRLMIEEKPFVLVNSSCLQRGRQNLETRLFNAKSGDTVTAVKEQVVT